MHSRQSGFTLPELLVAAGAICIMLALLFVFVHPHDYTIQNRNAARWLDVAQIMQGIDKYHAINGKLPDDLTDKPQPIGNADADNLDLCPVLVPGILKDLPIDPRSGLMLPQGACIPDKSDPSLYAYASHYTIKRSHDGTVTVAAPEAEARATISLSRKF